jgi:hypothetical protein
VEKKKTSLEEVKPSLEEGKASGKKLAQWCTNV